MEEVKETLGGLGGELSEVVLDSFLIDGVLKDIPGVNIAVSTWKTFKGIREYNFLKKLGAFLENFHDCSDEFKKELRKLLLEDDGEEILGEKVIFLIDNADGKAKSRLLGRCLLVYKEEKITRDELLRFWYAVDKCFLDDLKHLGKFEEKNSGLEGGWSLESAGLLSRTGFTGGELVLSKLGERFWNVILSQN